MKKFILVLLIIIYPYYSFSQSSWQNTFFNNPNYIYKFLPRDTNTFFCFAGSSNCYLKTTNNGGNWITYKLYDSAISIRDGQFINSQTGWLAGYNNYKSFVFKTINGGLNWNRQFFPDTTEQLFCMNFINENTGFIGSGYQPMGRIYKTTNGGINWTVKHFPDSYLVRKIIFINNLTGWALGNNHFFSSTTDCGNNWIDKSIGTPFSDKGLLNFYTSNGNNIWISAVGYYPDMNGYIYSSTNSGQNWSLKYTYSSVSGSGYKYYSNISFLNNSTGFLSNNSYLYTDKDILMTTNAGDNWIVSYSNLFFDTYSMCIFNNSVYVAGGIPESTFDPMKNYVFKSSNSGLNWNLFEFNWDYTFSDVYFKDLNNGLAIVNCSSYNPYTYNICRIYKTTNKGSSWNINYQSDSLLLRNISFADNSTGIINCYGSKILRTTNFGINWTKIQVPYDINKVTFINQNTGFSFGTNFLIKTTDKGISWSQINVPALSTYSFSDISFLNESKVWVCAYKLYNCGPYTTCYNISIKKTTDSGNNWISLYDTIVQSYIYSKIKLFDDYNGIIIRQGTNKFFRTTNSGYNWFDDQSNFNINADNFYMINANTGWIYGSGLSKTTDGGHSWFLKYSDPNLYVNCFFPFDTSNLWLGCNKGAILYSSNGGNVFIRNISNNIPNNFSLSQNYPNPFNPTTTISFKVKSYQVIKLVVYDILGKELAVLVNEKLQPGEYKTSFDGSGFPSGVYFYSLFSDGNLIETKKMLMIK